ncbi:hypothetical protein VE04_08736 [Pseudogymnoascus sp. 24MN13]|nr:hypothetical protein VE04_08736 [Pseudogymnoascus sp. 24MN13]
MDVPYCIAASNECCNSIGGPGKTGHAGVPAPLPTDFEMPTTTGHGPGAIVTCSASNAIHNDGLECYGSICEGKECCGLVDAKATTPFPSGAKQTSSPSDAGRRGRTTTARAGGDKSATVTGGGASGTGVSTNTPTGAAVTNALSGAMVVAMGVLGVAML